MHSLESTLIHFEQHAGKHRIGNKNIHAMCVCNWACMHVYVHVYVYVRGRVYVHMHVHVCVCVCMHAYVYNRG
jgi:hypothetical protein